MQLSVGCRKLQAANRHAGLVFRLGCVTTAHMPPAHIGGTIGEFSSQSPLADISLPGGPPMWTTFPLSFYKKLLVDQLA